MDASPPIPSARSPVDSAAVGRAWPVAFVFLVTLAAAIRLAEFIERYSVNVFFYDQWDFLRNFFAGDPSLSALFYLQHGPHREGVGLLLDKYLYPLTSWNARVDSYITWACLIAAALLALELKRRLFGRIDYWDAVIPMLFLTLVQFDTFIVTPNPAYSGFPMLLLMLYLLALLIGNEWLRYGAVLAINYLLIFTGFGIFMGVVTIALFAWLCYRSFRGFSPTPLAMPALGLLIAAASFASFFYHYVFQSAVDCFTFPHYPLSDYPKFVALMFSSALGIHGPRLFALLLGAALLSAIVWTLAIALRRALASDPLPPLPLVLSILIGYSTIFAVNTALGRVCLGLPQAAQPSRYATLMFPALLGLYLHLRTLTPAALRPVALTVLALALVPGHVHHPWEVAYYAERKNAWVQCYRQNGNIGYCDGATHFKIYPDAARTKLQEKLDYLRLIRANLFAD
jgi:hypothetical protein